MRLFLLFPGICVVAIPVQPGLERRQGIALFGLRAVTQPQSVQDVLEFLCLRVFFAFRRTLATKQQYLLTKSGRANWEGGIQQMLKYFALRAKSGVQTPTHLVDPTLLSF